LYWLRDRGFDDMTQNGSPNEKRTKFCVNCGSEIDARAEICPKCGVRVAPPPPAMPQQPYGYAPQPNVNVERKNEGLAAVLSFLFVGLGQIYNGEIGKGIAFITLGVVIVLMLFPILIGIPFYLILWAYNIYDAYDTAKGINAGQVRT
jgi:TM2 domain-containing membrane protein YozV